MSHTPLITQPNRKGYVPFYWLHVFVSVSKYIHLEVFFSVMISDSLPFHLLSLNLIFRSRWLTGQLSSHSIKHARWLVVTTTSLAACSSPGSATIKAGSPQTRYASTSGTPCRTCSHTVPIRPCSSLTCKYPDPVVYSMFHFLFSPFTFVKLFSRQYDQDYLFFYSLKDEL